jgi:type II secretory pathway component GspD/PulD (secretin)
MQALPQTPDLSPTPAPNADAGVSPTPAEQQMPTPTPTPRDPSVEPGDPSRNTNDSFWLEGYPLNDLFQYLARLANFQYFHNRLLDSESFKVTGELFKGGDPMENMREIALQYDLVFFKRGRTIYALTHDQMKSSNFYVTKQYRIKNQLAEYLLQPIANFLGIVKATPADDNFPGYPKPAAAKVAPAANGGSGLPTNTGDQSVPRYIPGVPFDAPMSTGGFDPGATVFVERSSNSLVVRATPEEQDRVAAEISRLDREERQILLKTYVLEVDANKGEGDGIDWTSPLGINPGQGATFSVNTPGAGTGTVLGNLMSGAFFANGLILNANNLSLVVHALQTNNRLKSNNSPMTVAKSGMPVTIRSVTTQTIFLQTAAALGVQATTTPYTFVTGLTIDVIARILDNGLIDMNLNPTLSTVTGQSPAQPGTSTTVPIISTRSTTANVTVRSGEAAVIGGILQDNITYIQSAVPGLARVPLVGLLFRSRINSTSRTNLIVIVSPTIVAPANRRSDRIGRSERAAIEGSNLPGEPPPISYSQPENLPYSQSPSFQSNKDVRLMSRAKRRP